mmetsp:Transcript_37235/g.60684  ORF Transcript_37235/g.60684 Transcript_37235/m.60684 type:complete len:96 (+) Transcript_37235:560-847(+)
MTSSNMQVTQITKRWTLVACHSQPSWNMPPPTPRKSTSTHMCMLPLQIRLREGEACVPKLYSDKAFSALPELPKDGRSAVACDLVQSILKGHFGC